MGNLSPQFEWLVAGVVIALISVVLGYVMGIRKDAVTPPVMKKNEPEVPERNIWNESVNDGEDE